MLVREKIKPDFTFPPDLLDATKELYAEVNGKQRWLLGAISLLLLIDSHQETRKEIAKLCLSAEFDDSYDDLIKQAQSHELLAPSSRTALILAWFNKLPHQDKILSGERLTTEQARKVTDVIFEILVKQVGTPLKMAAQEKGNEPKEGGTR